MQSTPTVDKTPNKTQLTSTVDIAPSKTQLLLTTQQSDMSCRLVRCEIHLSSMLSSCNYFLYVCSSCTLFRAPARHTGVLDIYRYTLARRYAGALVYYLARQYAGVRVTSLIFLQKFKKWHLSKKNYQKGPQHACSTYLFKNLLQLS